MTKRSTSLGGMLDRMSSHPAIQESINTGNQQGTSSEKSIRGSLKKVTFEFPQDFARELKATCAREGISMRDYVLRAIKHYQMDHPD